MAPRELALALLLLAAESAVAGTEVVCRTKAEPAQLGSGRVVPLQTQVCEQVVRPDPPPHHVVPPASPPESPRESARQQEIVWREVPMTALAQFALVMFGYDVPLDEFASANHVGLAGEATTAAIKKFQESEKLPQDGTLSQVTRLALATRLYREFPDQAAVLDLAAALLSGSATRPPATPAVAPASEMIESHIKGEFEGWDGDTLFVLDNGQIWQQASYAYTYHYAYRPKVTIFPSDGVHKMIVDGVHGSIAVRRVK